MEKQIYHRKSVDELTFTDDGMFQAVMRRPEICGEVIERLLHVKVEHVEYPELEKVIEPYYTTKSVRLDVYLKDVDKVIDVECQSYPQESLGKRTRFYQSMIDTDNLMKGQDYSELKDSYILFICKEDPFCNEKREPYGLPCYTFRTVCSENPAVNLNDNTLKVIYNSSAYKNETDKKIRSFLQFVCTNAPEKDDDFSNRISEIVAQIKQNEEFRSLYAAMNLHDRDLTRWVREETSIENAITIVKKYNASPEAAANDVGVPLEKLLEALKKTEDKEKSEKN